MPLFALRVPSLPRRPALAALALATVAALTATLTVSATPALSATSTVATRSTGTSSAWLPYWDQAHGYQAFLAHAPLFSELDPFWYELSAQGGVQPYPGAGDTSIVDGVHARGVLVVPAISNAFDAQRVQVMLASTASRAAHELALLTLVRAHHFDGIDIDYEGLRATDRNAFTAFVQELASRLHGVGKRLEVAVHPKTSEPGTWSGPQAQDYAAIGAAADRVQVMAYDYSDDGSVPGPIDPLAWVRDVAAFAASQINPAKVELGMPLYGYDWVGTRATCLTFEQVTALLASTGAAPHFEPADGSTTFTYAASGAEHTVWFSDAASVAAEVPEVGKDHLAGVALWSLSGQDAAMWNQLPRPAR